MEYIGKARRHCSPVMIDKVIPCMKKTNDAYACKTEATELEECIIDRLGRYVNDPLVAKVVTLDKYNHETMLKESIDSLNSIMKRGHNCPSLALWLLCDTHSWWEDKTMLPSCRDALVDVVNCWLTEDKNPDGLKFFNDCQKYIPDLKFRKQWKAKCYSKT